MVFLKDLFVFARRSAVEITQNVAEMIGAALERTVDGIEAAGKAALQDSARQSHTVAASRAMLVGQEAVDIAGYMVIQLFFSRGQLERNSLHIPFLEKWMSLAVTQFLF